MLTKNELARLQQHLTEYDRTREELLELTRKTTRLAGWAIIQIHRQQLSKAKMTLKDAEETFAQVQDLMKCCFGGPPWSIILPGRLHFVEAEALKLLAGASPALLEAHG